MSSYMFEGCVFEGVGASFGASGVFADCREGDPGPVAIPEQALFWWASKNHESQALAEHDLERAEIRPAAQEVRPRRGGRCQSRERHPVSFVL
eukprot:6803007-Pyramimonas_sp.AAC.1